MSFSITLCYYILFDKMIWQNYPVKSICISSHTKDYIALVSHNSLVLVLKCTVWKFHYFAITQILCEINFGDYVSAKTVVSTILGALNFAHLVNCSLQKVQKFIKIKIQSLQMCKNCWFCTQRILKLISHKIWVIENSWNFHTVKCTHSLFLWFVIWQIFFLICFEVETTLMWFHIIFGFFLLKKINTFHDFYHYSDFMWNQFWRD